MSKRQTLIYSVSAWILATGILNLLRYYGTAEPSDWMVNDAAAVGVPILMGGVIGFFYWIADILAESRRFRHKSYAFIILLKSAQIIAVGVAILFAFRIIAFLGGGINAADIVPLFFDRLFYRSTLASFLYLFVVSVVVGFIRQMITKTGPRVSINLLLGKYRHPREEERLFVFIDLKSSTAHAETLGHLQFSKLIRDCFFDLTDSAIKHQVEIYQYVGDEVVLTWKLADGLKDNRCIHSYFDFQDSLNQRASYYQREYGLVPEFKAGVNGGTVVVTEVGVIKREIAYHSDVLNTAARIEGKCNELGQKLLITAQIRALLAEDSTLYFESVGTIPLRGKQTSVQLIGVTRKEVDPS